LEFHFSPIGGSSGNLYFGAVETSSNVIFKNVEMGVHLTGDSSMGTAMYRPCPMVGDDCSMINGAVVGVFFGKAMSFCSQEW
jgi:hypothetical protein